MVPKRAVSLARMAVFMSSVIWSLRLMVFPKVDERWLELKKARLSVLQRALLGPEGLRGFKNSGEFLNEVN
jgi:hypothetical protein